VVCRGERLGDGPGLRKKKTNVTEKEISRRRRQSIPKGRGARRSKLFTAQQCVRAGLEASQKEGSSRGKRERELRCTSYQEVCKSLRGGMMGGQSSKRNT